MNKAIVIAAIGALSVAACQTPSPYPSQPGFYEAQIDSTHTQITYVTPQNMPRPQAEQFLMLRAADITLEQGHDWFRIISRGSDVRRPTGPTISLGAGNTSFGRSSSVGVGVGTSFNLDGGPKPVLLMEIVMGDGPVADDRTTYDAAEVAQTIRAGL